MASASVTVKTDKTVLRVYGGNRREVRELAEEYTNMEYPEFLTYHPQVTEKEYATLEIKPKYNKKSKGGRAW